MVGKSASDQPCPPAEDKQEQILPAIVMRVETMLMVQRSSMRAFRHGSTHTDSSGKSTNVSGAQYRRGEARPTPILVFGISASPTHIWVIIFDPHTLEVGIGLHQAGLQQEGYEGDADAKRKPASRPPKGH